MLLDRLILREWLPAFGVAVLGLAGALLLEDWQDDLGDFFRWETAPSEIIRYYLILLPGFLPTILPLAFFMSIAYALASLRRRHEIVAMQATGSRIGRLSLPLFAMAGALAIAQTFLQKTLLPWSFEQTQAIRERESGRTSAGLKHALAFYHRVEGRVWLFEALEESSHAGRGIVIAERSERGGFRKVWLARRAVFLSETSQWRLRDGVVRDFDEKGGFQSSRRFSETLTPRWPETPAVIRAAKRPEDSLSSREQALLQPFSGDAEPGLNFAAAAAIVAPWEYLAVAFAAVPLALLGGRGSRWSWAGGAAGMLLAWFVVRGSGAVLVDRDLLSPWAAALAPNGILLLGGAWAWRRCGN